MATDEIKAQLTKVRQEMAKLLELLDAIEPPRLHKLCSAKAPAAPAKKTRART